MKESTKETLLHVVNKLLSEEFSANDADWLAHLVELAIEDEEK